MYEVMACICEEDGERMHYDDFTEPESNRDCAILDYDSGKSDSKIGQGGRDSSYRRSPSEFGVALTMQPTKKFTVIEFLKEEQSSGYNGELKGTSNTRFFKKPQRKRLPSSSSVITGTTMEIFLDLNCSYTRQLVIEAFTEYFPKDSFHLVLGPGRGMEPITPPSLTISSLCHRPSITFQFAEYERIDWTSVLSGRICASSYFTRKGLSRKAQLALYTQRYTSKHPDCSLSRGVPYTIAIDTWSAFEETNNNTMNDKNSCYINTSPSRGMHSIISRGICLKDKVKICLQEAQEAMESAERGCDENIDSKTRQLSSPVWILKPSTINKGDGICIVHCIEEVLECTLNTPDIREWVLQRYITNPLLLRGRKFHIRAYALAVSSLTIYLYNEPLILCSGTKYEPTSTDNTLSHLTNTSHQLLMDSNYQEDACVLLLCDMIRILLEDDTCATLAQATHRVDRITQDMRQITRDVFASYKGEYGAFAPIEKCFEHYGIDFMVDDEYQVYLLEVNPGPDFQQTGSRLRHVIRDLMIDTISIALCGLSEEGTALTKVYECLLPTMRGR